MSGSVIDASALLALLRSEPGADRVLGAIVAGDAVMSAVSFSEVAAWYARHGADETGLRDLRERLLLPLVPVDDDLALRAALFEPCVAAADPDISARLWLALADRLGATALTADPARGGGASGVTVEVVG